jgi:hypothetical protein
VRRAREGDRGGGGEERGGLRGGGGEGGGRGNVVGSKQNF